MMITVSYIFLYFPKFGTLPAYSRCGIKKNMSSADDYRQLHVIFSGRVQGVGFRYTVCELSAGFDVTGSVKNLWDGDVELTAEGSHQELMDFLNAIRASRLGRGISKDRIGWNKPSGRFTKFGIEF